MPGSECSSVNPKLLQSAWHAGLPSEPLVVQKSIPQKMMDNVVKHAQFTDNKVRYRLSLKVHRPDFLSEVLKHNDKKRKTVN